MSMNLSLLPLRLDRPFGLGFSHCQRDINSEKIKVLETDLHVDTKGVIMVPCEGDLPNQWPGSVSRGNGHNDTLGNVTDQLKQVLGLPVEG